MPSTRTAEKELRVALRRRARNKSTRSATRTKIKKVVSLIKSGNLEEAQAAVKTAISALDKEAEKGVSHKNNAARRKSRLMKKLNALIKSKGAENKPAS
ncbi:MAG: 30S ribosomal protein S20 [Dehalococcoidales bacterium]|nr:30S ribosomal protein S20 [Dehalococcoidales bacterium]